MPNWITTNIEAPKHVIKSMLDANGKIDFNKVMPFEGTHDNFEGICVQAEDAAKIVCREPLSGNLILRGFELENIRNFDIKELTDESFEQFIAFLRNFRECGYFHSMDFAKKVWGTKWNACDQSVNVEEGRASFETAWACPTPVLKTLSERFPNDEIRIQYADEDIGCNCGKFTLKNGIETFSDIAPSYQSQSEEEKKKWRKFAYEVKGRTQEEIEEDQAS